MIEIKCGGQTTRTLQAMKPLQGTLKHRNQAHVDSLILSLQANGLLQPFIIWEDNLLDGHGRHTALMQLAGHDRELFDVEWPVVNVEATDLNDARAKLLEMNTTYGKITPKGLEAFLAETPAVKVPSAFTIKMPVHELPKVEPVAKTHKMLRLRVELDKVEAFTNILKTLAYVEVV